MRRCLVSFPKSGRTWLRRLLDGVEIETDRSHAGSSHTEAMLFEELGTQVANEYDKILLLIRDPRDTAVSGYHWSRTNVEPRYTGTLGDFLRDPRHGVEKIARFNLMWSGLEGRNLGMVTYEDLRADTLGCMKLIVDFLGASATENSLRKAIDFNSFAAMQQREAEKAAKRAVKSGQTPTLDQNSFKTRRGVVGGYKSEATPEDIEYCDRILNELRYQERIEQILGTPKNLAFPLRALDKAVQP
jgi:hypothetical protein